jgi:ABC-2 type transport system ATP-binding protein
MEIALRFNDVSKCFGRQPVLKKFDLSVYAGECVGLVGVNGAGKTTLLKCLLNLCDIDGGSIEIFAVNHLKPEARARLAFLPEQFVAPYFATGDDFLRYMSRLYGIEYAPSSVQQTLASLDLDRAMLSKPVRQLSKGMAQKLGLAATLLSRKDLFVLDEPMNGLDPETRARFKHHLLSLKGQGHTLFFSTHLLLDVEALCDHIAILHEGELRFIGSPRDCSAQFGNGESLEQAYLKLVMRDDELKDLA